MPKLRYVGRLDELTPERLNDLRARVARQRRRGEGVWDARTETYTPNDETGLAVYYGVDPRPVTPSPFALTRWQGAALIAGGALLGLLLAGVAWWMAEGKKKRKKKSKRKAAR